MTRSILIGLIVLVLLSLTGCSSEGVLEQQISSLPAVTSIATQVPVAMPTEFISRTAECALGDAEFVWGLDPDLWESAPDPRYPTIWSSSNFLFSNKSAWWSYYEGGRALGDILDRWALDHSINPKVLLALLEYQHGGVITPIRVPFDPQATEGSFKWWLYRVIEDLNYNYYGWKYGDRGAPMKGYLLSPETGSIAVELPAPPDANAGHFAVTRYLGLTVYSEEELKAVMGDFASVFQLMFGAIPEDLLTTQPIPPQPELLLPWSQSDGGWLYAGPHMGFGTRGTVWAAVDFGPPEVGCSVSPKSVIASASGVVLRSEDNFVWVDLDEDSNPGTGWVLLYGHMAEPVPNGTLLQRGDRIGYPSCLGGLATRSHLHFASKYNGEWVPAELLELSGWRFTSSAQAYQGTMEKDGVILTGSSEFFRADGQVFSDNIATGR